MAKINPLKDTSKKLSKIKDKKLPPKPHNIEEAIANLRNFFVKEKEKFSSLRGKAHQLDNKFSKEIKKIKGINKRPKNR